MLSTARDICQMALADLGILNAGETAAAGDAAFALAKLNLFLDQCAGERIYIYSPQVRTTWTIVANTQVYTVGTGGTVNVERPVFVDGVNFIRTDVNPNYELPMAKLTDEQWAGKTIKTLTSTLPTEFYYNPTYPLGTLTLWPVPTLGTLQGALYAPQAVAQLASLDTSILLPPGYQQMLVSNLAVLLGPAFEREVSPIIAQTALDSKATVQRDNFRIREMGFDAGAVQGNLQSGAGYLRDFLVGPT